jgi:hypothetical protein
MVSLVGPRIQMGGYSQERVYGKQNTLLLDFSAVKEIDRRCIRDETARNV